MHQTNSEADVVEFLRGEHQRFLSAKLAIDDFTFDVRLESAKHTGDLSLHSTTISSITNRFRRR
jgi:hypothetical protein